LNRGELFLPWGCREMMGETFSWGPTELVSLFGTTFAASLEPVRVQDGWAMTIADGRALFKFGVGFPMTSFEHNLDDFVRVDFDGDGALDVVTSGDGIVRRATEPSNFYAPITAAEETTLLNGNYQFIAVADLAGSSLLDIFYMRGLGQVGLATQTSPGLFTEQLLATGETSMRLQVADVDGDRERDVVGAMPNVFIYSTRADALIQLDERARAIAVGDIDGDGVAEPVFLTENGTQVRRVGGLTTAGPPESNVVLNTTEADTLTVAQMDRDSHSDVALIHEAGEPTSWFELRLATSFGF
jgi:hypothetical protein